jgi:hypothetical protein
LVNFTGQRLAFPWRQNLQAPAPSVPFRFDDRVLFGPQRFGDARVIRLEALFFFFARISEIDQRLRHSPTK